MIHENKCEDGKDVLKDIDSRINDLNKLKALYDDLNWIREEVRIISSLH